MTSRCIWVSFMSTSSLLDLADRELQNGARPEFILEDVFNALTSRTDEEVYVWTSANIRRLLTSRARGPSSQSVQKLISTYLSSSVPLGITSFPHSQDKFGTLLSKASLRWCTRVRVQNVHLDPVHFQSFLTEKKRTEGLGDSIAACLYRSVNARREFQSWLTTEGFKERPIGELVPALQAFFETRAAETGEGGMEAAYADDLFSTRAKALLREAKGRDVEEYVQCLFAVIQSFKGKRSQFAKSLLKKAEMDFSDANRKSYVILSKALLPVKEFDGFIGAVLEHSLHWTVEHLSSAADNSEVDSSFICVLGQ